MCLHTIQRLFTAPLLLPIPITLTLILATTLGWGWHGARLVLRWVPGLAAPGAIAIGITATLTSITTTRSTESLTGTPIETPIGPPTGAKLARGASGSKIGNAGGVRPMVTAILRANSAAISGRQAEIGVRPVRVRIVPEVVGLERGQVAAAEGPRVVLVVEVAPQLAPVEVARVPEAVERELPVVLVEVAPQPVLR